MESTDSAPVTTLGPKGVWSGVLSNIQFVPTHAGEIVSATMSRTIKGVPTETTLFVSGEALPKVRDLIVDGATVHLYGQPVDGGFAVIGPDLRRRTLARASGETPAPKDGKVKRTQSPAQVAAFAKLRATWDANRAARKTAAPEAAAESAA